MKFKDFAKIYEGMMKRSDPYISGEKDGTHTISHPAVGNIKKSGISHNQKIESLARKGKVQPSKAQQIWEEERDKIDYNHPNRWAIIMTNVKKRLGIM